MWHNGLLHKLVFVVRFSSVSRVILRNKKHRVNSSRFKLKWQAIHAVVPQGSILGPIMFLLYINDITSQVPTTMRLFVDDTSLFVTVKFNVPVYDSEILNDDISKITAWADRWLINFNATKTETLLISRKTFKPFHPPLFMNNHSIKDVSIHKHLGLFLSNDGKWHAHIDHTSCKAWQRINIMRKL